MAKTSKRTVPPKFRKKFKKNREEFDSPEYKEWVRQVKARDKNRCQMPGCKRHRFGMEVHHIIRWCDNPFLRYNVSNGIVLCHQCHNKVNGNETVYAPLFIPIVHVNTLRYLNDNGRK